MKSPFEILGIEPAFALDEQALEERYYSLCRQTHPDRFTALGEHARAKSQELSAQINQAYQAIRKKESRLETLLELPSALKEGERSVDKGQLPADLAEEFFEIQEAVMEEAESAKKLAEDFRAKIEFKREELTEKMYHSAAAMDWTRPDQAEVAQIVSLRRERSYLRSMLENLEKLGV